MTPSEVKAIRDQVGGTKAMAEKLEVTDRLVRYWCVRGIVRKPMAKLVRGLVDAPSPSLNPAPPAS